MARWASKSTSVWPPKRTSRKLRTRPAPPPPRLKSANGDASKLVPSVFFQSASGAAFGLAVFLRVAESADIERVRHEFVKRLSESYRAKDIKLA